MKPVPLLRPAYFLWLIVPVAVWLLIGVFGLPHVIWSYDWNGGGRGYGGMEGRHYTRCTYVGPHGAVTEHPGNGRCGWVRFAKKPGRT